MVVIIGISLTASTNPVSACTKEDFDKAVFAESGKNVIFIGEDGSVDPATAPIQRNGNTYTLIDDVYAPIIIDRDNLIIDGAGHNLIGPYNGTRTALPMVDLYPQEPSNNSQSQGSWSVGIDIAKEIRHNLTVTNLNIKNFSIGMWIWTQNNTITGNALTENIIGILLSSSSNTLTSNYIAQNDYGIFFGANQPGDLPVNTTLSQNGFLANQKHLSGCVCEEYNETEELHTWDDGHRGNYWSNYNGSDADGDGIGDTPYIIDSLNRDRYPFMQNLAVIPTVKEGNQGQPYELIIVVIILSTVATVAFFKRKTKMSILSA